MWPRQTEEFGGVLGGVWGVLTHHSLWQHGCLLGGTSASVKGPRGMQVSESVFFLSGVGQ